MKLKKNRMVAVHEKKLWLPGAELGGWKRKAYLNSLFLNTELKFHEG